MEKGWKGRCRRESEDNPRFRESDRNSQRLRNVEHAYTPKYIGERLPLEASHCSLEYVLRLSGITNVQDIVNNHRSVSFADW